MYHTRDKIRDLPAALQRISSWRIQGDLIVFSNGCFDLIHPGHIEYLEQARQLGDRLVLGLNADVSVKKLKGEDRPINNERARAIILAALVFVDMVIIFEEDTPQELIQAVSPDILVKGGDYIVEEIVGYEWVKKTGGKILTIPLLEGYSTTSTIKKLRDI
ncbi:MAG: D-glycero-beta-D-manno-heptose 1-phosphate adenylyltransferase [Bacteroidia bacterium]|nr:D-glycero-beta-D-manno-heptose 1-phosphate adenylyltransferase [Bacteroidia bacterium]